MVYDVIVIGAGLSGLSAASLLAKRGLQVLVIDKSYNPGGSCGIFKRDGVIFDQGSAMLYGFGEHGYNSHRFLFNCLEEPIDMIRHDLLYVVNFKGQRIRFFADVEQFIVELSGVFPKEAANIRRFYHDMLRMYQHVMVENPSYTSADESDPQESLPALRKHPISFLRFFSYLNKGADALLGKYFRDPEIFKFFDKLTSTYCYATVKEAPAVLASVMFVDNHVGGSYYPAGSTLFLPGKLEKVIEENGGDMLPEAEVARIMFQDGKPSGVELTDGRQLFARDIIYSGTVWNLYGKLLDPAETTAARRQWAASQAPTYPSVVLYALVDKTVIPEDTAPVEMLVGNPDLLDESEVTAYIFSIDDHTLCPPQYHTIAAIGPSFETWQGLSPEEYQQKKAREVERLTQVLERRFPGFRAGLCFSELATPRTIERYCLKNGGAVAGPKQMLGQHMLKRLHTRTEWENLFCCGESTVQGTGTPSVTTSGISAANAVLKKRGLTPFKFRAGMPNYVRIVDKPFTPERLFADYPMEQQAVMRAAFRCQFCENPGCSAGNALDFRGMLRRVSVGNFIGARKIAAGIDAKTGASQEALAQAEQNCVVNTAHGEPVAIRSVMACLLNQTDSA
jgi:prolycopene isomerase